MSAIHTGRIDVRTVNGRQQFFGKSEDHAVTGWPEPKADQKAQARIPAQRAGNAYEQVVLDADDLTDLGDFADIPQLSSFVRDYIRAEHNETEAQP